MIWRGYNECQSRELRTAKLVTKPILLPVQAFSNINFQYKQSFGHTHTTNKNIKKNCQGLCVAHWVCTRLIWAIWSTDQVQRVTTN